MIVKLMTASGFNKLDAVLLYFVSLPLQQPKFETALQMQPIQLFVNRILNCRKMAVSRETLSSNLMNKRDRSKRAVQLIPLSPVGSPQTIHVFGGRRRPAEAGSYYGSIINKAAKVNGSGAFICKTQSTLWAHT